jgi:ubiquitin-protein ligase
MSSLKEALLRISKELVRMERDPPQGIHITTREENALELVAGTLEAASA